MPKDPLSDFDREILEFLETAGIAPEMVELRTPPEREFGERSANAAFLLARERRQPPRQIAAEIAAVFEPGRFAFINSVEPAGNGFINFRLNYVAFGSHLISAVEEAGAAFGRREIPGQRVIVEHTSVNPNKEWHIGHVRNAVLGDVVARILRLAGSEVEVQNYIDDTGPQAAEAVWGLRAFPENPGPDEKYDHYVGRGYVKVNAELSSERALRDQLEGLGSENSGPPDGSGGRKSLEARLANIERLKAGVVRTMHDLEEGKFHETTEAVLAAQLVTAYRLHVFYNLLNWESHLVQSHLLGEAIELLEKSEKVYRPMDGRYAGALVIELSEAPRTGEEPKREVLIRSNGLPTYVGKDIAYHMWKLGLLPDHLRYRAFTDQPNGEILYSTSLEGEKRAFMEPQRVINVIGVHQSLAQEVVREGLRAAGFPEQGNHLFHLAYGLVSTAGGKMSGRKGTTISGDDVIDEAVRVALERVREKRSQDLTDEEMERIAEAVGVGAVRYFMVQHNPLRDVTFDVSDVVSYDGNTGLYVQYALVRMFAILRRAASEHDISVAEIEAGNPELLQHEQEKRLIFHLAQYPELIATAARTLSVNLVAEYAFDLATIFSQFYRDCGVLNAEPDLRLARLLLVKTVRDVLSNASAVLGVPVIERL